jgi:AraC-like DNA-binding protein
MLCRKEHLEIGESVRFWRADDIGDVELLHARYRTHSFGRHTHEGFAIGVIQEGVEGFSYRGTGHHAGQGQIIVFNPDEAHTGEAVDDFGWRFRIFYFDPELLRNAASQFGGRGCKQPFFLEAIIQDDLLAGWLRQLHVTLEESASLLERQSKFLWTFAQMAQRHSDCRSEEPTVRAGHLPVRRIREYLDENFIRNVSIQELVEVSGFSPYHMIRIFRNCTGLTPHLYLEQVRINRARQLLRSGVSIIDTALQVGFTDQSHLNRHFKKMTGITPGKYLSAITSKTPAAPSF